MLRPWMHHRKRWTREQKQAAVLVGLICLLAWAVWLLISSGLGRIP